MRLQVPDMDSNLEKELCQGKAGLDHRGFEHMNLVAKEALQILLHIVAMKQMEIAQFDTMVQQVQVKLEGLVMALEVVCQLAVDDGIYKLHQTYTVQFSHSRNTLFHPVVMGIHNNLEIQGY